VCIPQHNWVASNEFFSSWYIFSLKYMQFSKITSITHSFRKYFNYLDIFNRFRSQSRKFNAPLHIFLFDWRQISRRWRHYFQCIFRYHLWHKFTKFYCNFQNQTMLGIKFNNFMLIYTYIFTLIVYMCVCKSNHYDDAQETGASLLDVHTAIISIKIFQY
jgi:hypothetical protein